MRSVPTTLLILTAALLTTGAIAWTSSASRAADVGSLESAKTPEEVRMLRQSYIDEFQRISLNTTADDARMLRILVRASHARRGIEVGTATGYGALHMGMAFDATDGKLITVDIDPEMVRKARAHLKAVGLEKRVDVVQGDALEVLPKLEGTFDFVFIDAVKRDYLKYFLALEPKLEKDAVIVADNVVRFADAMRDFLDRVEKDPRYDMVTIRCSEEKRDGMAIIYKRS